MYPGMVITYKVSPFGGFKIGWMTEITHVEPLQFFVDEQRHGPYAIWHHEHHFRDLGNGRVEMRDIIHYKLPMGWLGQMVQPWLVAPRLNQIFDFRLRTVETLFG
jgi:ligand-binding SRPBCC domain-containing protein